MSDKAFQAHAAPIAADTPPPENANPIEDIFKYYINVGLMYNSIYVALVNPISRVRTNIKNCCEIFMCSLLYISLWGGSSTLDGSYLHYY